VSLGLPELLAGGSVLSLNAYVLMGGADFGGGLWDLLATGPRRDRQRALVAGAIAPIWEANHVWLILVIVMLFTGFPAAFARLTTVLHIPLTLMLVGIVLRGSAFTFRSYDSRRDSVQRRWGRLFAIASAGTPCLLGIVIGAIVSGRVREPTREFGATASFADVYLWSWLSPFAIGVGLLAVILFAFLAAVYLTIEARDEELQGDFRLRALWSAAVVFVIAGVDLLLARTGAPLVWESLTHGQLAAVLHALTALSAIAAIVALWVRRYSVARVAAAMQVSLILWGWAVAQYPHLVPPDVTIRAAAAPPITLALLGWALGAGFLVLVPSLWYLFRVFKRRADQLAP
jgi:cytochrome bd ubiquinol oxidase subunit II